MKASEFDNKLLHHHLDHVASEEVRRATLTLVQHAEVMPGLSCSPNYHGVIRRFGYTVGDEVAFAFIFNKESLLFYVRKPALNWPTSRTTIEFYCHSVGIRLQLTNGGEYSSRVVTPGRTRPTDKRKRALFAVGLAACKRP